MSWKVFVLKRDDRLVFQPEDNEPVEIHMRKTSPTRATIAINVDTYVERHKQVKEPILNK